MRGLCLSPDSLNGFMRWLEGLITWHRRWGLGCFWR